MIPEIQRGLSRSAWTIAVSGAVLVTLGTVPPTSPPRTAPPPMGQVSFAGDVMPIFQARCVECHGATDDNGEVRLEASLNLTSHEGVMAGSEFGSVVEPGDTEGSYLLELIVEGDMPEEGDPVPEEEIDIVRSWIQAGAPNN